MRVKMNIVEFGLYSVLDQYFTDYQSEFLCDNKGENRPYYCSIIDSDGIIWLIPLSTQIDSYKQKIARDEQKFGAGGCLLYHTGTIMGKERVFLIGNMFPVTDTYIKKPYTFSNIHYIIQNQDLIKQVGKRANKFLALVKQGRFKPNLDIIKIKTDLLK